MEFDEGKTKPDPTFKFLQQQVKEQSEVCDITVKMGYWARKYHRCVLAASPFFECVLKNDFLEKNTGTVHVNLGTPTTVDIALMFLYGKKPKLDDTNVEVLIDLAEFFLIPNLKSDCVSWLKKQSITDENCMSFLQLSTRYGFELPNCTEYIEGNLNAMLEQQPSGSLTYESIYLLFTKKKLRYLRMEDRLRFLIRWFKTQPERRKELVKTLLDTVDYDEIPISILKEIKQDHVAENLLSFVNGGIEDIDVLTEVLISGSYDSFLCYDLARDLWFKIARTSNDAYTLPVAISDTTPDLSELFLTENNYTEYKFLHVNLTTNEIKSYDVVSNERTDVRADVFHFSNDVCVMCKSEVVESKGSDSIIETTTVFIGSIIDEMVRVTPQFSVVDSEIESVTVNKNAVIAMIPLSRTHVLVYDSVNCTLDKIEAETGYGDEIFPTENGFVIHNNERYKTIVRMSGPALSVRYAVEEFILSDEQYSLAQYYYCNNTWFRYFRKDYNSNYHFQSVNQINLEESSSPSDVEWKELSLPNEDNVCTSSTLGETMHVVRLPRRLLRCHVECPHCKAKKPNYSAVSTTQYYYDDSGNYMCNDSFDSDDVYVEYDGFDYCW